MTQSISVTPITVPLHQHTSLKENKKTIGKILLSYFPFYTLTMFILYMTMYYTVPPGTTLYNNLKLETQLMTQYHKDQIYRWYTYSLLHANGLHLLSNMLTLMIYGILLESGRCLDYIIDVFTIGVGPDAVLGFKEVGMKTLRIFIIHTFAIIGSAFAVMWESVAKGNSRINVVGASGGIYGLYAAHLSNLVINWTELSLMLRTTTVLFFSGMLIGDITMTTIAFKNDTNKDISYTGHIGGAVMGLLTGIVFLHNIKKLKWELYLRIVCLTMALGALGVSWIYAWTRGS